MLALARAIDRFNERAAVVFAWLFAPLLGAILWEVVSRYAFSAPTRWAYETIYMLCGAMFMLGAAYALRTGAHVRTDVLSQKWSPRTRALIDAAAYLLFFLPGMALFLAAGAEWTWMAYVLDERSADTSWFPPLWPLKAVVPGSAALLLAQGLAELLRALHALRAGAEAER